MPTDRQNAAVDRNPRDGLTGATPAETNALERAKELDFEQRARARSVARVTLPLGFLRLAWGRFWTRTKRMASAPVPHPPAGTLAVTFVGHATVMITTPTVRLLTDPLLENSLCGLRRIRAAAIDAQDLADVGLVLISHAHRDHLSRPTLARLPRTATLVVPPQCGSLVADLGFARVVELGTGQAFGFGDVEVITVPVRHSGVRGFLDRRRRGASGYVIRTQGRAVYFAGDTGYFSGFAEIGRRFNPDVALLPVAAYQPAPFRDEHMSPLDAVYAFEDLNAGLLIPIAHGSFELGYEPVDEPLTWLRELGEERKMGGALAMLEHGQTCLLR
jgi:L-ascorbate metabolism protein UlaG (beta-lactamase superfamily)